MGLIPRVASLLVGQRRSDPAYVDERLALARITTGLAVARSMAQAPKGEFLGRLRNVLDDEAPSLLPRPSAKQYEIIRGAAAVSALLWAAGVENRGVAITANAGALLVQREVVKTHSASWNYNTHLNAFLLALTLAGPADANKRNHQQRAATVTALQVAYSSIYLQSGVAKLKESGWRWADGNTLKATLNELGTPLGRRLASGPRWVSVGASTATLGFELGFGPALAALWRYKPAFGIASVGFHAAVQSTMRISFWHLWWNAPALFCKPEYAGGAALRLHRRVRRLTSRQGSP